jgi:hypothetical protein
MMARAALPERAEKFPNGSTSQTYATIPITIEGIPCKISTNNPDTFDKRVFGYSDKYTPARTPIGAAISVAFTISMSVPTIAFRIPPPASPTGFGIFVINNKHERHCCQCGKKK